MITITDEMRNAFYSKAEVQRTGAIRYLDEALIAAFTVRQKYTREQINEMIGRGEVFADTNPEADFIAAAELACPHCGGSGHRDDIAALAVAPGERTPSSNVEPSDDHLAAVYASREEEEKLCKAAAMAQWEASLKRPDLTERDRVRGAIETYSRQAFACAVLATAAEGK